MVQFNLLPDVKLAYVKARRSKQMIVLIAGLVAAGSLFILVLLFLVVFGVQKKHLNDVNKDIATYTKQLKNTKDLDKILTIQNQLNSLPALHAQKPVTSRLFGYLGQITPAQVSISSVNVNFASHTMLISGSADNIVTINTFVDTLKFTTYTTTGNAQESHAFSDVVLSSFSIANSTNSSYAVSFSFDAPIFDSSKGVVLNVPAGKITTRSETAKPTDLFKQPGSQ
ncbi:MAG TPA: hypothetical protein VLF90_04805 [Patescibacteria group bacterium]|nr:hypothetical protein [Patescibacteria group bacterium]